MVAMAYDMEARGGEDDGARQHEHGGDGVERHHDGAAVDAIGQHASEWESRMVGTMEMASTEAKMVAEPVSSSTHIDIANRSITLPNSEMPCPATSSTKSRTAAGVGWRCRRCHSRVSLRYSF